MRQRDLFEPAPWSGKCIPEALELELIGLLAHLMLSTLSSTAAAEEEDSDEPNWR